MVDAYHTKLCPPAASPASVAIPDADDANSGNGLQKSISIYCLIFPIHEAVQINYFISLHKS